MWYSPKYDQIQSKIVNIWWGGGHTMNFYKHFYNVWFIFSDAKDLIEHLLVVDKKKRYTAIETLSHPWILCNGDMSRPPDSSKMDDMRKTSRKELELQAKQNYDSYQKVREKRKLEQGSWSRDKTIVSP